MTTRTAFGSAAGALLDIVGRIGADQWERTGLGGWTVRELAAHAMRALTTVEQYVDVSAETDRVDIELPWQYFARILHEGDPDIHQAVLERGRAAGAELVDPQRIVAETVERVLGLVDATDGMTVVRTPVGSMRLDDYLATRIIELVVHTLDLGRATGLTVELDQEALDIALSTLVCVKQGTAEQTLMVLTGREQFPPGFNVLGSD